MTPQEQWKFHIEHMGRYVLQDRSPCLPSWLETYRRRVDAGEAVEHSVSGTLALCHTLAANLERAEQLIYRRDVLGGNDIY